MGDIKKIGEPLVAWTGWFPSDGEPLVVCKLYRLLTMDLITQSRIRGGICEHTEDVDIASTKSTYEM